MSMRFVFEIPYIITILIIIVRYDETITAKMYLSSTKTALIHHSNFFEIKVNHPPALMLMILNHS